MKQNTEKNTELAIFSINESNCCTVFKVAVSSAHDSRLIWPDGSYDTITREDRELHARCLWLKAQTRDLF